MSWNYTYSILINKLNDEACAIDQESGRKLLDAQLDNVDPLFLCQILLVEPIQKTQRKMSAVTVSSSR